MKDVAGSARSSESSVSGPPKRMSAAMKFFLVALGVLVLLAVVVFAGVGYVGYRVHKKAEEISREYHVDETGAHQSPPLPTALPDACSLISKGDIEAIISQPVQSVDSANRYCYFHTGNADSGVSIEVQEDAQLSMKMIAGGANLAARAVGLGADQTDRIPGIGDEAYYIYGKIYFRKGDVMVTVDTTKPLLSRQITVAIAQKASSKM